MKPIFLTGGLIALVDDEDYDSLNQYKWSGSRNTYTIYAVRSEKANGKFISIPMHRQIMSTPKGMIVDHIDHCGLNNQKSNLRNCSYAENCRNKRPKHNDRFVGVYYSPRTTLPDRYNAVIGKEYLGSFLTPEEAARVRDKRAKELYGEFANLNFK